MHWIKCVRRSYHKTWRKTNKKLSFFDAVFKFVTWSTLLLMQQYNSTWPYEIFNCMNKKVNSVQNIVCTCVFPKSDVSNQPSTFSTGLPLKMFSEVVALLWFSHPSPLLSQSIVSIPNSAPPPSPIKLRPLVAPCSLFQIHTLAAFPDWGHW